MAMHVYNTEAIEGGGRGGGRGGGQVILIPTQGKSSLITMGSGRKQHQTLRQIATAIY